MDEEYSDPVDWRSLYPFSSHVVTMGGLRYHYLDEGCGDVLLMVHGNPTWSFYWRNLVLALRGRYRVIVPDHIGCGMSDKPQRYPYTLAQHIENLLQLIDRLNLDDVTLLGHDWGGAIGLGAAVAAPQRFSRYVLFNTGAFPPEGVPWRIRLCRVPVLGSWAIRRLNLFAGCALWMATEKPERLTPQVKAGLLAPYDCWPRRVAIDGFVRDIPLSRRHPTYWTLSRIEKTLGQLQDRPMQFIWGMRDWCFTPACLDRFLSIFPNAEVHRLHDAGHYVVEDAHEQIAPLVEEFLSRHPIGSPA